MIDHDVDAFVARSAPIDDESLSGFPSPQLTREFSRGVASEPRAAQGVLGEAESAPWELETGLSRRGPHARRRAALVALVVVALVGVVAVATVVWFRNDSSSLHPAERIDGTTSDLPALALTSSGPADCSSLAAPNDVIVLAVTVAGGHAICGIQAPDATSYYFDGQQGGGFRGPGQVGTAGLGFSGGIGIIDQTPHLVILSSVDEKADWVQLESCTEEPIELRPLNDSRPYYVAAIIDAPRFGPAFPQQMTNDGERVGGRPPGGPCDAVPAS